VPEAAENKLLMTQLLSLLDCYKSKKKMSETSNNPTGATISHHATVHFLPLGANNSIKTISKKYISEYREISNTMQK
jgi:hypothetical protein